MEKLLVKWAPGPEFWSQLGFRGYLGPKTGLQDGGGRARKLTDKMTISAWFAT